MTPEELSMWTLFNSGRIAGALGLIASAIFIWLGFRVAAGTLEQPKYSPLYFVLVLVWVPGEYGLKDMQHIL